MLKYVILDIFPPPGDLLDILSLKLFRNWVDLIPDSLEADRKDNLVRVILLTL